MKMLSVALAKGRLAELSLQFFEKAGYDVSMMKEDSRRLIFTDEDRSMRFFLVKPSDVPTYVDYGAADVGIAGWDTILEEGRSFYEVLNLGFGACRMVLAGPKEYEGRLDSLTISKVATKYPNIAREYFQRKRRESVEIIRLSGSVELAPLVGLAQVIVDIVESGRTLKDNGLVVLDTLTDISARLIVNRVSMKLENERIGALIENFRLQLDNKKGGTP
ncbi:MAG TPA: ATP phosphoribosyltransferase [Clostridiales bacterium]|nr:ATP phosphoribosyltransferase [Clostridiales bacterium]